MLTDSELKHYFVIQHRVPEPARQYITAARASEPSRMVGAHARRNSVSFVYSSKMSRTISTESRGPERYLALLLEHDEEVLEYWDQPPALQLTRTDSNGNCRTFQYTPDFLVLSTNGPRLVEVKSVDKASALTVSRPNEWVQDAATEEFRFLPAEAACEELGLDFEVFVYSKGMRYRHHNLELLAAICDKNCDDVDLDMAFRESYAWTLSDLKQRLKLDSLTPLLQLIRQGELHADLDQTLLAEPRGCLVVRNQHLLQEAIDIHAQSKLDDPERREEVNGRQFPCERYAEAVLNKLARINSGEVSRSTRRWKQQINDGAKQGLSEFQSLIPKYHSSRRTRLHPTVRAQLQEYLTGAHSTARGMSTYRSYTRYCAISRAAHAPILPVSWETFRRAAQDLIANTARGRGGRRSGHAHENPTNPSDRLIRAGVPWQLAAIDHSLTKIYLRIFDSDGVVWVMKAWLTAMVDLATKKVLAYTLSFQPPSRRSVACVLRDCVRRHGRLPMELIVDRGADFKSVYLASLCAHYRVTLTLRPASHPRYGSEVERLFGEFMEQHVCQLPGNTLDFDRVRSVDGKLKPGECAVLEPYEFHRELESFLGWRETKPVGVADVAISKNFEQLSNDYRGVGIDVCYDDDFLLVSSVDSGRYKLDHKRGIHIDALHYWHPDLSRLGNSSRRYEVRRDPENPHIVYANVENKWLPCTTSSAARFNAMDSISQRCEFMKMVESKQAKVRIRQMADEELAAQIMKNADHRQLEAKKPISSGTNYQGDDDELFNIDNVVHLNVQNWG